ncbi:hypothetical protein Hanom_Chr00s000003g01605691 [Helianthus anomalus]
MELEAGSKLAKKPKHQGVKWLFLKVWSKTVKVTKPQGAKRKFTLKINWASNNRNVNRGNTKQPETKLSSSPVVHRSHY